MKSQLLFQETEELTEAIMSLILTALSLDFVQKPWSFSLQANIRNIG